MRARFDSGFDFPSRWYQQISLPTRAARPTQPSILPRSVNEYWITPGLTQIIDLHWWYDRRLRTYDPGSVGRTQVNWVDGTSAQVCIVNVFLSFWVTLSMFSPQVLCFYVWTRLCYFPVNYWVNASCCTYFSQSNSSFGNFVGKYLMWNIQDMSFLYV